MGLFSFLSGSSSGKKEELKAEYDRVDASHNRRADVLIDEYRRMHPDGYSMIDFEAFLDRDQLFNQLRNELIEIQKQIDKC